MKRNPARYKTRTEAREGGGKELVLLSTASLSQKGRRAYRAQIRAMAEPEEAAAGVHGTNERIPVRAYLQGIRDLIDLMEHVNLSC